MLQWSLSSVQSTLSSLKLSFQPHWSLKDHGKLPMVLEGLCTLQFLLSTSQLIMGPLSTSQLINKSGKSSVVSLEGHHISAGPFHSTADQQSWEAVPSASVRTDHSPKAACQLFLSTPQLNAAAAASSITAAAAGAVATKVTPTSRVLCSPHAAACAQQLSPREWSLRSLCWSLLASGDDLPPHSAGLQIVPKRMHAPALCEKGVGQIISGRKIDCFK